MANDNAEDRKKKQGEPRRAPPSPAPASEPLSPPLIVDGPELVRDTHT